MARAPRPCAGRTARHAAGKVQLPPALAKGVDVLVASGGDGTVSAAAAVAVGRDDVVLGVIPRGTGNSIATSLAAAWANELIDENWNQIRTMLIVVLERSPDIVYVFVTDRRQHDRIIAAVPPLVVRFCEKAAYCVFVKLTGAMVKAGQGRKPMSSVFSLFVVPAVPGSEAAARVTSGVTTVFPSPPLCVPLLSLSMPLSVETLLEAKRAAEAGGVGCEGGAGRGEGDQFWDTRE